MSDKTCICLCFDIPEKAIRIAIGEGHDSIKKLTDHLGIAKHCGGCVHKIKCLIDNENKKWFRMRILRK